MAIVLNDPIFNEQYGRVKVSAFHINQDSSYPTGGSEFKDAALDVLGWTVLLDAVIRSDNFGVRLIVLKDMWKLFSIAQGTGTETVAAANNSGILADLILTGY